MRRRVADIAIITFAALLGGGCGFKYEPTAPSDGVEEMLLSETLRIASAASVKVRGEMTETIASGQVVMGQEAPTAWYSAGVAWFYRPQVKRFVSIEPEPGHETATNVAGHEVCHAVTGPMHGRRHWQCMSRYAGPTYPEPASGVWTGAAYARIGGDHGLLGGVQ